MKISKIRGLKYELKKLCQRILIKKPIFLTTNKPNISNKGKKFVKISKIRGLKYEVEIEILKEGKLWIRLFIKMKVIK